MSPHKRRKQPDLILGDLPVERINLTLGTQLEAGVAVFSRAAQTHAARRHANDYPVIAPHVASIVLNPLYVGDDLRNGGKIELIGKAPGSAMYALVAVSVELDELGRYHVASLYPVSREKIENRRQKGFLRVLRTN
jgi:hypothetical protein